MFRLSIARNKQTVIARISPSVFRGRAPGVSPRVDRIQNRLPGFCPKYLLPEMPDILYGIMTFFRIHDIVCLDQNLVIHSLDILQRMVMPDKIHNSCVLLRGKERPQSFRNASASGIPSFS